jgi:chromosome segregation ATPase
VIGSESIHKLMISVICSLVVSTVPPHLCAAGDTFKHSAELGKRTAKTSADVDKYVTQLNKTEQALASIAQAQAKDLKERFDSFSKEIDRLEDSQRRATADIEEMKAAGVEYFTYWETAINQLSNPELKQASAERRSKVMEDHDGLAVSLSDIGQQLQPFLSDLHDLRTFLEANLSLANTGKAGEMIQKSQADAQALKDKLDGVQAGLRGFLSETPR